MSKGLLWFVEHRVEWMQLGEDWAVRPACAEGGRWRSARIESVDAMVRVDCRILRASGRSYDGGMRALSLTTLRTMESVEPVFDRDWPVSSSTATLRSKQCRTVR